MVICLTTIKHAAFSDTSEEEATIPVALLTTRDNSSERTGSLIPDRLVIPSLAVDAQVQQVGISKHGTMAVPTNYTDVGWYRYGSRPGEEGHAVFAGHVDNGFGAPGVFQRLKELAFNDDLYIKDASSTELHFKVSGSEILSHDIASTDTLFTRHGPSQLTLITCEGEWDPIKKEYSERRIITAVIVDHE